MSSAAEMDKESFRDSVSTMDERGKRKWVYAQKPFGKLYNIRKAIATVLLAFLFAGPFLRINGEPFLLLNVLERKFVIFGKIFWPQDFFIFGLAMITFFVFIVLFTIVYGRIWCGYACPQTIFMEFVFRRIEYFIEGDAGRQKALDKGPWNTEKILRKGAKHIVFFLISFLISNTFLAYIIGSDQLKVIITDSPSRHIGQLSSLLIFTGVFYAVYAWFREQVCSVVCPYGRLQGVLLDQNSIIVAYDYQRGEPRGKQFKNKALTHLGDCTDCGLCAKVCPAGIDIRNGTQLECINCSSCVDACNFIMDKVGKPRGLIRFASEREIREKAKFKFNKRILSYTIVLTLLLVSLFTILLTRKDMDAVVLRTPGMLFQKQADGRVSNLYNFKIINKTTKDYMAELKLESVNGSVKMIGGPEIHVLKEAAAQGSFFIILDPKVINRRKMHLTLGLYSGGKKIETIKTNFIGPNS